MVSLSQQTYIRTCIRDTPKFFSWGKGRTFSKRSLDTLFRLGEDSRGNALS
jgi:hypothetical protein